MKSRLMLLLVVLGLTVAGLVHLLLLGAAAIVFLSGNRARRRAAGVSAGTVTAVARASAH